jgi:hypothetical protein
VKVRTFRRGIISWLIPEHTQLICLDTSAINNLLDDADEAKLTTAIINRYEVCITALNILEIAKTKDPERRERLRAYAKHLGREIEPIELPNHLVRLLCRLFHDRATKITWNVAEERRQFWVAMSTPNSLGEQERQEAIAWTSDLETQNTESNIQLRELLAGTVVTVGEGPRPVAPGDLFRAYLRAKWPVKYEIPSKVYKRATGKVLPLSKLDSLLEAKPSIWPLYLMAYAFSTYYGAIWAAEDGLRNPAGLIDLWYAVYLPLCEVFVTHDTWHGGQYRALRVLNAFSSRRPRAHVLTFNQFKAKLLQD